MGKLARGESILINGASGAVGTIAIQIAKHIGAKVTAVTSGTNAKLLKSLGADQVIDYTKENFMKSGQSYDVIMDTHGNTPFSRVKKLLMPGGRFLLVIGSLWEMIAASWQNAVIGGLGGTEEYSTNGLKSFKTLMSLAEKGEIKAVIDSIFPLERIVEAHRKVDGGHKVGSIIITFDKKIRSPSAT